ncbi:hypothetical protein OG21DRAFT_1516905 [Imleria badia]|nr:hypothetical protein OG21DRAFT_1516905 [Imleria badia]
MPLARFSNILAAATTPLDILFLNPSSGAALRQAPIPSHIPLPSHPTLLCASADGHARASVRNVRQLFLRSSSNPHSLCEDVTIVHLIRVAR